MPLFTFPAPKKDKLYSFKNPFGIPDNVFNAIVIQAQKQIDASPTLVGSLSVIDDADYTVLSSDTHVLYKNLTAARTLTVPSAASSLNRILVLGHGGGGSFLINLSVTVRLNSSTTINSIGTSAAYITIISDGTEWWLVTT